MESKAYMQETIIIRYYNEHDPKDNSILIRDLVPSLQNFQRSLDKISIYVDEGRVLKNSKLSHGKQFKTDLYIQAFEDGSFKVPMLGFLSEKIKTTWVDFMKEPYEKAASDLSDELVLPLNERLSVIKDLDKAGGLNIVTEQDLADGNPGFNRRDAQAKFLRDFNKAIYPVTREDGEGVDITLKDGAKTHKYEFNKRTAKRLNSLVERTVVEEPILCHGTIHGLGKKGVNGPYRFHATYVSEMTGQERHLYVVNEDDANALKPYNLGDSFSFLASPVSKYGAYDTMRGNLIFIRIF